MKALVIAEHDNRDLKAGTLHTLTAARKLGAEVHVLVAGSSCAPVAGAAAKAVGVSKVLVADAPHYGEQLAENLAQLVVSVAADFSHILAPASSFGKNLLPRVAALLDVAQISDVSGIEAADTFVRAIYAGNAVATVQSDDEVKVLTVRTTAFEACGFAESEAKIAAVECVADLGVTQLVGRELIESARPDLGAAKIVVAGGRGLGSAENFRKLLDPLADRLGAAIGASRAAVDAGYVPNDSQIGQTGKIVAPQLYIAVGLSGAIQHLAGMKESGVIVAINKDADAPIFQVADYGLVGDLFQLVPELTAALA